MFPLSLPNRIHRVLIKGVEINSVDFAVVEKSDSFVEPQREHRRIVAHEQGFRLPQEFGALAWIGLLVSFAEELVEALALPAGPIVAIVAHPNVEKGIWVIVIRDPTAAREIVVD